MTTGILIIEDEVVLAKNIKRYLERYGYELRIAGDGTDGLAQVDAFHPDLVLLDFNLPGANGLDVLAEIRRRDRQMGVIFMTGHGNVQLAVDAMKAGADDYLSKPLVLNELKLLIERAIGRERLEGALSYYRGKEAGQSGTEKILGQSPSIAAVKQRIALLLEAERGMSGGTPPTVLITGETGTGKELVARAIHFDGPRREAPFVELNCAAIPLPLLESELFGHERGAFTDARERKLGLVETAQGGTLFLDEIGDIDPVVQVKLLKLLEERTVRRLGSLRDSTVDVRIVVATNRSLDEQIRDGKFRSDLYFRLNVVNIHLPPLRERGKDILVLAEEFLRRQGGRYGKPGLSFSAAARAALSGHPWPGNVRELRNVIERAVLLSTGEIVELDNLSSPTMAEPAGASAQTPTARESDSRIADGASLTEVECGLIQRALLRSAGNITSAARSLGISRDTLRYRIKKHGMPGLT